MKQAAITLDIEKGDTLLGGRFKNHKTIVKDIGTDELGQPTINGMKLLSFRIAKKMPEKEAGMNQDYVRGFVEKCAAMGVDPTALLQYGKTAALQPNTGTPRPAARATPNINVMGIDTAAEGTPENPLGRVATTQGVSTGTTGQNAKQKPQSRAGSVL